jgi:hypothetical protein
MTSTRIEELEAQVESLKRWIASWTESHGHVWAVRFCYEP